MNYKQLVELIHNRKSFLCIGLDTDIELIPKHFLKFEDPVFEFNKEIVDATIEFCVAYKPNIAFYEALGISGWKSLEKTMRYIQSKPQSVFTIADAKRGDIGNTSKMYAKAFFDWLDFDAITVAPYMGEDSVSPFLSYKDKFTIILGLTSNSGSKDFQFLQTQGDFLYNKVIEKSASWGSKENTMFVVGATHPDSLVGIRGFIPENFILVPGVGAQGGSLQEVCKYGLNEDKGLLINSTRQIIYASSDLDFAVKAAEEARNLCSQMTQFFK